MELSGGAVAWRAQGSEFNTQNGRNAKQNSKYIRKFQVICIVTSGYHIMLDKLMHVIHSFLSHPFFTVGLWEIASS